MPITPPTAPDHAAHRRQLGPPLFLAGLTLTVAALTVLVYLADDWRAIAAAAAALAGVVLALMGAVALDAADKAANR